jgi:hypothetical protein
MSDRPGPIVRTTYRYKRPPRKRKAAALEVPAIVTIDRKTRRRVSARMNTSDLSLSPDRIGQIGVSHLGRFWRRT